MSARPRRQTKPTYKARADGEKAQRRASTKTVNKSRVNADSPRDPGVGREEAWASADSPRGSGPGLNASNRATNSSHISLDSSDPPNIEGVSTHGQGPIDSRMQQMIQATVERILAEARSAESPREVGTSQGINAQHEQASESRAPVLQGTSHTDTEEETERLLSKHKAMNKRKRKQSKGGRRKKAGKVKQKYQDSDTSEPDSDEGMSDNSRDGYDTEEDQELALLRESFGMLIGENLPAKQRQKILSGKFVEMAALLPRNYTRESDTVYRITKRGISPATQRFNKFITIQQWNQAFGVYKSVLVESAETLAEAKTLVKQLETYHRDINTMAEQGSHWRDYDRVFRSDMAERKSGVTFGTLRHDIMLNVSQNRTPAPNDGRRFRARRDRQSAPRNRGAFRADFKQQSNECFRFNSQRGCTFTECKFSHTCTKCGGTHPAVRCFKTGRQFRPQQNRGQGQGNQNTRTTN